ncbi:MAG TPA: B-box zinc finger protein [Terracidiphilus sp.]|nr:B-box zinc finger protein [Terracidiphilus sp.]
MDCVNHNGVQAAAFCQNCGKALCAQCVRSSPTGQVLCEPCMLSFQNLQQPFVAAQLGGPNPVAAGVLGLIPGVGAMYNGQFFKALIHVVIFAVIVSLTGNYPIFGIFIAAWILYQAFEAYHTALARRDGQPLPDPLGLNEVGNWLNLGSRNTYPPPPAGVPPMGQTPPAGGAYPPGAGAYPPGVAPAPPMPPIPPVPPLFWRRREPIGAIFLVGFGLILLLNQMGWVTRQMLGYLWPLVFIGFGVWLIVRRMGDAKGGSQ